MKFKILGLISCGVQCDVLFGQGFDGASNMSGKFNGVQAIIREQYPQAIYVHCAAHSLNLAVFYVRLYKIKYFIKC